MTESRSKKSKFGWLLVGAASLTLLLSACADDEGDTTADPVDTTPAVGTTTEPTPAPTDNPTTPSPEGEGSASLAGSIEDIAGVGVTGSVAVTETAGMTEVDVDMTGLPEGSYSATLVAGGCDALGDDVVTLGEIEVDASGEVIETYSVSASMETIAEGHSVVIEDEAELVACAELA